MSYLYELHCHTSEVSGCGRVSASDIPRLFKENGYHGVVITDHLTPNKIQDTPVTDWKKYINRFLVGYKIAKEAVNDGFTVLLGAEIRFPENNNDYLLFGITEEFLYSHPYINRLSLQEFRRIADENGILIIQAHPMRNSMVIMNPDLLDGYEVYNGNKRHNSRNMIADAWAELNNKIKTSGSDFHQDEDLARGGVYFEKNIATTEHLVHELKKRCCTIKTTV